MTKNYYKCECGKEFDTPNKFNGHKSSCLVHMAAKGVSPEDWLANKRCQRKHCRAVAAQKREQRHEETLAKWVSEKHICERCGKIMVEKFGSGRFCSRGCANSKPFSREATEKKLVGFREHHQKQRVEKQSRVTQYSKNPKRCEICGAPLPYEKRTRRFCSKACVNIYSSQRTLLDIRRKGPRNKSGVRGHCIFGTIKDIECDSSWELAFVVYHLDHKLPFVRNRQAFTYTLEGKEHLYYPDFILGDGTYVEIKNYWTEQVQAKIDQFPKDLPYRVLYYEDIKPMIKYCNERYGKNFPEILYDKSRPNYYNKKKR